MYGANTIPFVVVNHTAEGVNRLDFLQLTAYWKLTFVSVRLSTAKAVTTNKLASMFVFVNYRIIFLNSKQLKAHNDTRRFTVNDFLETVACLFAFVVIAAPVVGFVWFMRYIKLKERKALIEYGFYEEKLS